jgi:hypothetical protein
MTLKAPFCADILTSTLVTGPECLESVPAASQTCSVYTYDPC